MQTLAKTRLLQTLGEGAHFIIRPVQSKNRRRATAVAPGSSTLHVAQRTESKELVGFFAEYHH